MEYGADNGATSPGRSAVWSWKFVIPKYAPEFRLEKGQQQILVKLRRIAERADSGSEGC